MSTVRLIDFKDNAGMVSRELAIPLCLLEGKTISAVVLDGNSFTIDSMIDLSSALKKAEERSCVTIFIAHNSYIKTKLTDFMQMLGFTVCKILDHKHGPLNYTTTLMINIQTSDSIFGKFTDRALAMDEPWVFQDFLEDMDKDGKEIAKEYFSYCGRDINNLSEIDLLHGEELHEAMLLSADMPSEKCLSTWYLMQLGEVVDIYS